MRDLCRSHLKAAQPLGDRKRQAQRKLAADAALERPRLETGLTVVEAAHLRNRRLQSAGSRLKPQGLKPSACPMGLSVRSNGAPPKNLTAWIFVAVLNTLSRARAIPSIPFAAGIFKVRPRVLESLSWWVTRLTPLCLSTRRGTDLVRHIRVRSLAAWSFSDQTDSDPEGHYRKNAPPTQHVPLTDAWSRNEHRFVDPG